MTAKTTREAGRQDWDPLLLDYSYSFPTRGAPRVCKPDSQRAVGTSFARQLLTPAGPGTRGLPDWQQLCQDSPEAESAKGSACGEQELKGGGSRLGHQFLGLAPVSRAKPSAVPSRPQAPARGGGRRPPSGHGRGPGTYVVGVAVGAVETHSAEGVARNGSRHDGNLHLPHHASRRAQSMLDAPALSILGNGVFQAAPGENWGRY